MRFVVTDGDGGTSSAEVMTVKVSLQSSGAVAVWRENGATTPEYNLFDGVSFDAEGNSSILGEWRIIQGADAPTRSAALLITKAWRRVAPDAPRGARLPCFPSFGRRPRVNFPVIASTRAGVNADRCAVTRRFAGARPGCRPPPRRSLVGRRQR